MRRLVLVALAALFAGTAHAQFGTLGSAVEGVGHAAGKAVQSGVNAVEKGTGAVTGAVTGEREAKARIESSGYSDVTDLSKDSYGIWHAKAQKLGMPVRVSLDTRGNVKTD
jgi:periplasmic protein CpxP/Spy